MSFRVLPLLALSLLASVTAHAGDLGPYGKWNADFRYRYEFVDQDGYDKNANASTARLRLGYETPVWQGLNGYGEIETIRDAGPKLYNDGQNGHTEYPRVNDPGLDAVAQLYLNYKYDTFSTRIGRQHVSFDNERFIGWTKWRQNDTSQDAAFFQYDPKSQWHFNYAYVTRFNRYAGSRNPSGIYKGKIHLMNARYDIQDGLSVSAYTYLMGFERKEKNQAARTTGLRLNYDPKTETIAPFGALEFARQSDYGCNPVSYGENYYLVDVGAKRGESKLDFAYEYMGGDGTSSVQTPMAGQRFLGWTDKFSNTPADGIQDFRVNLTVPHDLPWQGQSIKVIAHAHHYLSSDSDQHYGDEFGASFTYTPVKNHDFTIRAARYKADELYMDTTKVWLMYEAKF